MVDQRQKVDEDSRRLSKVKGVGEQKERSIPDETIRKNEVE